MKNVFLAGAAVLALTGAAAAADLTYEPAPAPAAVVSPMFDWTGFYAGVHGGGTWGNFDGTVGPYGNLVGNVSNALGGAQIGYNYQVGQFVIGAQTDIAYTSLSGSSIVMPGVVASAENNWLGSTTVRAGYAMDTWLFYGKGGLAYGNIDATVSGPAGSVSNNGWNAGWTLGAGIEKAFTKNVTGFLEYDYMDLGNRDTSTPWGTTNVGFNTNIVKAGINYKF